MGALRDGGMGQKGHWAGSYKGGGKFEEKMYTNGYVYKSICSKKILTSLYSIGLLGTLLNILETQN